MIRTLAHSTPARDVSLSALSLTEASQESARPGSARWEMSWLLT
jgi:hypothetical protein